MVEFPSGFIFVGIAVVGTLAVFLIALIVRFLRGRKDDVESELLRQYPELTEIVATEKSRDGL